MEPPFADRLLMDAPPSVDRRRGGLSMNALRRCLPGAYIFLVAGAAIVVLVAETAHTAATSGEDLRPDGLFYLFAALLVAGELRPIGWLLRVDAAEVTATWSFAIALILVEPGPLSLAVIAGASLASDLLHRKQARRLLFNAAQLTLSVEAARWLLAIGGAENGLLRPGGIGPAWLLLAAAAAAAAFLTNGLLTSVVLALVNERPLVATMREAALANAEIDGMLLALAPILVVVAQRSLALVPLVLGATWIVYRHAHAALATEHEATHDPLTGLPNRRLFHAQLDASIRRAERRGEKLAVLIIDLDGFKEINDRLGHETGDLTLQRVGDRLTAARRSGDAVARLGGDEFAVLLRDPGPDREAAAAAATRLHRHLTAPIEIENFPVRLGASVGVAVFPDDGVEATTLLEYADTTMYIAKRERTGVEVCRSQEARSGRSRRSLLGDLRHAIDHGELDLHYQPKVLARTRRLVGAEALIRWSHPQLGPVRPDEFVKLAEQTELIDPLTDFVVTTAARDCALWVAAGLDLSVAVNGSAKNVEKASFARSLLHSVTAAGLDPHRFELEITENAFAADVYLVRETLKAIRESGVQIALDDFGTGFSSLTMLRQLEVDSVKIDRSFVSAMRTSPADAILVEAVVDLAHRLGLTLVGEGVEDEDTAAALTDLGCDVLQGYLLSPPLQRDEFAGWAHAWHGLRSVA